MVEPATGVVNIPQEAKPDKPGAGRHRIETGVVRGEGAVHRVDGGIDMNMESKRDKIVSFINING